MGYTEDHTTVHAHAVGDVHTCIHVFCTKTTCRWLKEWGIALASERQQRTKSRALVGSKLAAEEVPLTFPLKNDGEEIRAAPMVYTPDLPAKIFDLLELNRE